MTLSHVGTFRKAHDRRILDIQAYPLFQPPAAANHIELGL